MTGPDYSEGRDWHTIMTTRTRAELAAELLRMRGKYGKLRGDEYRTHQRWLEAETRLDALRARLAKVREAAIRYMPVAMRVPFKCYLCGQSGRRPEDIKHTCPLKETTDAD